jgi:hypothetical protein
MLWNDLEININHYHWSGWLGENKVAHYSKGVHANFLKQDFEWAQ